MKSQLQIVLIGISVIVCLSVTASVIFSQQPFAGAQPVSETTTTVKEGTDVELGNQSLGEEVEFDIFYDPELGISMQYPVDWRVSTNGLQDYSQLVSFYSPLENLSDAAPVQVTVSRVDYSENITLDDYTSFTLNATQALGINGTESNVTLSQTPAYQLITSFPSNQVSPGTDVLQAWTVNGNVVYIIRYLASADKFSTYLPIVEQMINSFQVDNLLGPAELNE